MTEFLSNPPPGIPAATVVVFRHAPAGGPPELLMVQRAKGMRFSSAAVFPGGRVDPGDFDIARQLAPDADPLTIAAQIAGIRETLEETGLVIGLDRPVSANEAAEARRVLLKSGALAPVLDRFGWSLRPDLLVPLARWCPPIEHAFDTHFFLADLGTGAVDLAVDATENTHLFWASANEALRLADADEIRIVFPTRRNLERLAQFDTFADARRHAEATPVSTIVPQRIEREGEAWLVIPDGLGYPVTAQPMATVLRD